MARAIVPAFGISFGSVPDIRDDVTNGWIAKFDVFFIGQGTPGGFRREEVEVHFLDNDTDNQMRDRIRDAARAKAAELGISGSNGMMVVSFLTPTKL